MGNPFDTPKPPKPPAPPPIIENVEDEVKKQTRRYTGKGRAATILTSPLGIFDETAKTLLGG